MMDNLVSDPIISSPVILAAGILIGFGVHRVINEILYRRFKKIENKG